MKLEHVSHGQVDALRVVPTVGAVVPGSFARGVEARLFYAEREAASLVAVGDDVLAVAGDGRKNEALLRDLCTRNLPRLAWIVDVDPGRILLQVHTFLHAVSLPPIDLGVDEKALEALARIHPPLRAAAPAIAWLDDQLLVPGASAGGAARAFATAGIDESSAGFALHGRSVRASVRRVKRPGAGEVLLLDRIARSTSASGAGPLALVHGALRFVDATVAGSLRVEAAAELSALVASGSSFLAVWSRYGELENEAALRRVQGAGWLAYDHVEPLPGGLSRFFLAGDVSTKDLERFLKALQDDAGQSIEAAVSVPEALTRPMTWAEHRALPRRDRDAGPPAIFGGKIASSRRERTVTLERRSEDVAPPPKGVLFVSLRGDEKRSKRREDAAGSIHEARCPMPQLGLLVEGRSVAVPRRGNVAALTPAVKRKVFGDRSPTPTQERALWVALNTPDIALIQGPPGTGKTTILVALVERLQEVWDTSDGVQGRLLLSGFQHDAVENAVQRMSVNGLPPIKFGEKLRQRGEGDRVDVTVERWCRERATAVRAKLPPRPAPALQHELASIAEGYLLAPGTLEQTAALLVRVADRLRGAVLPALVDRLHALAHELSFRVLLLRAGDPDRERRVRLVRALRCTAAAFGDDGPRNAYRVAQELRPRGLGAEAEALLDAASAWRADEPPQFLDALGALRRRLLLALLPSDRFGEAVPRARTDVLALLTEARDELDRRYRASRDAADEAVFTYLDALESDFEAMKRSIISHTSVFAATCQQSAREELSQLKGSDSYDTVVVDEAARANPLDLFVPLAKAARRIVLVGDHRQLPHVLDRELERELDEALSGEKTAGERTTEMLHQSLFERLFHDLRERQARDGIPRVVTLDEQYRMHPALGELISREFYAAHQEAFDSPRSAVEFGHGLPGWPGPAGWLDVPRARGAETPAQSKSRPVEAAALVAELRRLMDSEPGRALTFGVITFYSAQVGALHEALERAGMAHRSEDAAVELVPPWRELVLPSGLRVERLRVGTVDAFQGMEFDVVLLSMVRSNALADATELERRRKYGHLMSPNRLCVAMSRQKRLLIVVGDASMLRGPQALAAIGPLVRLREISEVRDAAGL